MADIELVIKIPEHYYKNNIKKELPIYLSEDNIVAIIPKGHGRLIDVGQCDRELFYQQCGGENSLIAVKSAFDMLMSLPPIIEADKAESEE